MSGKKIEDVREIKVGRYIIIDDVPCKVVAVTHSKPGKHGGAKNKIDAIGIFDNQKRSIIKPSGDNVDVPVIDKRNAQILTVVGDNLQLMDMESFETFDLPMPQEPELKNAVKVGIEVLYMDVMGKRKILQTRDTKE